MASSTSTDSHKGHQRLRELTASKAGNWPGGLPQLLSDYQDGRATLRNICHVTGMQYRGLRRVLTQNGVKLHDLKAASAIAHKLHPEWGEHISETKTRQSFRHSTVVTAKATEKRTALFRSDPSRHGVSHMQMNQRERQFADTLSAAGIHYVFNQPAAGYFVDFFLPAYNCCIEIHRSQRPPTRERVAAIRDHLHPAAISYIPTHFFRDDRYCIVTDFLPLLLASPKDWASAVGDALFLWSPRKRPHVWWNGFAFKARWSRQHDDESSV